MSIFADIEIIISALKTVDTFLGTLPPNAMVTKVKTELDQALAVVTPLGL
jgi:hypothetical protein